MSESKREVFEMVLEDMAESTELVPRNAIDYWNKRYDAAGKVAVPQDVADVIKAYKANDAEILEAFADVDDSIYGSGLGRTSADIWIATNPDVFARAWLAWPNVEAKHD